MISVVIPTYKRPDLLARLLESICRQSQLPDEVIVVDDGSSMDEAYRNCIDQFKARLPRIYFHSLTINSGAPHARNTGIRLTKYEWIALVDDDDEWLPEKLARQWSIAQNADPKLGLIYTWTDAKGTGEQDSYLSKHIVRGDARRAILSTNFIMSASVMVRKQAIIDAGLFDELFPSCQDWDMWTRIFLVGYFCEVVPEILTIYHRHGGESIGLSTRAKLGYKLYIRRHFKEVLRHTSIMNIIKKSMLYIRSI
jgi:glycosyltransferase involved in cell wall biosynthesis